MMLNRTWPAVRVPLMDCWPRSVGAGRHLGDGERVRPTSGAHLLLLLLLLLLSRSRVVPATHCLWGGMSE